MADEIMIRVPRSLKALGGALQAIVDHAEEATKSVKGGRGLNYGEIEATCAEATAAIERGFHQDVLSSAVESRPHIEIGGEVFDRTLWSAQSYCTLAGAVRVERWLYRRHGDRNGATVDPIAIRFGMIAEAWLPETAKAMAYLVQATTSREAEKACGQIGRLPYGRSSFERVTHEVGTVYRRECADIEEALIAEFELPEGAKSVSVSLDRTGMPMAEPRELTAQERRRKKRPKHPVTRQFRMAWCACLTIHDKLGKALHCIRYGRMPKGDQIALCDALAGDVAALLKKNPKLSVVRLADGAAEIWDLFSKCLGDLPGERHRYGLVDFWHLTEKLAAAAAVIHGADAAKIVARWKEQLLENDDAATKILGELRRCGCVQKTVGDQKPVHQAVTYLENHLELMNYAKARRLGLPIGSGNIEATCKTLIGVRMKRCGSRWNETSGDNIVRLRALALSDRWDDAITRTIATQRHTIRGAA